MNREDSEEEEEIDVASEVSALSDESQEEYAAQQLPEGLDIEVQLSRTAPLLLTPYELHSASVARDKSCS